MIENLPYPFNIYRKILDGDHLHFGYWPDNEIDITLEKAQDKLFQLLKKGIPGRPCKILDVGCGLGASAYSLAQDGHEVVAIAPSEELIHYARKHYFHNQLKYSAVDFFEYVLENTDEYETFDVLMFQESLQYLKPLNLVFKKARKLLKEKGKIILCDEILFDRALINHTAVHFRNDLIISIFECGYFIKKMLDVGSNVMPTCDHVISGLEQNKKHLTESRPDNNFGQLLTGWKNQKQWYHEKRFSYLILHLIKDNIYLRPYKDKDEHDILPLFNQLFGVNRSLEHWVWKFQNNPYGKKMIALAVDSHDHIAAHYSVYPVRCFSKFNSLDSFLSCQVGDTMTHPSFRNIGLGPTSVLSRTATYFYDKFCRDIFPFMYGFNTGNIRKFGERYLGYIYNVEVPYLVMDRWKPIRPGWYFWKKRLFDRVQIRKIDKPDHEFDSFFNRVGKSYDLLVYRDSEYLKWRYFDSPDHQYDIYGLYHGRTMCGWAVFKKQDETLVMGDCLFDINHAHQVRILLEKVFLMYPAIKRVVSWCSPAPKWWAAALVNAGFVQKEEPNKLAPAFKVFDPFFSAQVIQDSFYYTMGDSDLF